MQKRLVETLQIFLANAGRAQEVILRAPQMLVFAGHLSTGELMVRVPTEFCLA